MDFAVRLIGFSAILVAAWKPLSEQCDSSARFLVAEWGSKTYSACLWSAPFALSDKRHRLESSLLLLLCVSMFREFWCFIEPSGSYELRTDVGSARLGCDSGELFRTISNYFEPFRCKWHHESRPDASCADLWAAMRITWCNVETETEISWCSPGSSEQSALCSDELTIVLSVPIAIHRLLHP